MNLRTIIKNSSYLLLSFSLERVLTVIAFIFLARYLGNEEFGILSVAMAFAAVAGYFTDVGLTDTVIRESSKTDADLTVIISSCFKVRMVLSTVAACISIFIITILYRSNAQLQFVMYWIVLPTIFGAALQGVAQTYFQAVQKMEFIAILKVTTGICSNFIIVISILIGLSLYHVAILYGVTRVLGGLFGLYILWRKTPFFIGWDSRILEGLGSFTLAGLVTMMLPQLGLIVLEKVANMTQVSFFSVANRIPVILYQFPGVVASAFYPVLFSHGNEKRIKEHRTLTIQQIYLMNTMATLITLPFILYPTWWIDILFGKQWLAASKGLAIMSWLVFLQSINYPLGDVLTTLGQQNKRTSVLLGSFALGLASYISCGYIWGSEGAAVAAILIELSLFVGYSSLIPGSVSILKESVLTNFIFISASVVTVNILTSITPIEGIIMFPLLYIGVSLILEPKARYFFKRLYNIVYKNL